MKTLTLTILLIILLSGFQPKEDTFPCQYNMEYAYFCGQRDAIAGKIIIKKINNVWIWTKTPWGNNIPVLNDTIYD